MYRLFLFSLFYASISCNFSNLLHLHYDSEDVVEEREVVSFIANATKEYLTDCTPYMLYDDFFYETMPYSLVVNQLIKKLAEIPFMHSFIDTYNSQHDSIGTGRKFCYHYVLLVVEPELAINMLDTQLYSKVILASAMSSWQTKEFLTTATARKIQNLLIIADPTLQRENFAMKSTSIDINLYTHELHVDGIGNSLPHLLTAWRTDRLTRPEVNLFPEKLDKGFNGHRFVVSAANQPPFVFRSAKDSMKGDEEGSWDGIEIRVLRLMADIFNMTLIIQDAFNSDTNDTADQVVRDVNENRADIGIAGLYITTMYYDMVSFSFSHSQDCATFITLTSTAMPKYRAILGPFRWGVWICIIFIYIVGVIPICYTQQKSFRHLFESARELRYTFWVVFGTFTNCFSFKGKYAWNSTKESSTRSMIGTYWVFTIIITAAYSSSIISFITIPTYFDVVDSVKDLLNERYKVGTLNTREWTSWFNETSDYSTNRLLKKVEILTDIDEAFQRVTKRKRYAFLGSKEHLAFLVRRNYVPSETGSKKSKYHLIKECLANFMVSIAMKPNSEFIEKINKMMMHFEESGLLIKLRRDVEWQTLRSSSGKLLAAVTGSIRAAAPEDRQLTVDDMQGMFLLLGIGVALAFVSLVNECWTGYNLTYYLKEIKHIPSRRVSSRDSDKNFIQRAVTAAHCIGENIRRTKNPITANRRISLSAKI